MKRDKINNKSPRFSVIEGGLKTKPPTLVDELRASLKNSCFEIKATNTRLMGVVGLMLSYNMIGHRFTQLFILDYEEYGIADYVGLFTDSEEEIEAHANTMFGALGGEWVEISAEESWALIASADRITEEYGAEFPEDYLQFRDAIKGADDDKETYRSALSKVCINLRSDYELVNYFIMRCVGKDKAPLSILCSEDFLYSTDGETSPYEEFSNGLKINNPSTLFKNDVEKTGPRKYICKSLVEDEGLFYLIISKVRVVKDVVKSAKVISCMEITVWESAMQLRRIDYVLTAECKCSQDEFSELISKTFHTVNSHSHENGMLYMIYRNNNDHVCSPHFRLDADLIGSVFFIDGKEAIVCSAVPDDTDIISKALFLSDYFRENDKLGKIERFKFDDKIIGPFIDSGMDDFREFIEFYKG